MTTEIVAVFANGTMVALIKEFPHPEMIGINYPVNSWGKIHYTDKNGVTHVYMNPVAGIDRNFVLIKTTKEYLKKLW